MKKWSWKAILGGLAIDLGGGLVLGILVAIPVVIQMARTNKWDDELVLPLPLLLLVTLVGLVIDALAGYSTAMWAPTRKFAHAAVVGCVCLLVNFLLQEPGDAQFPIWYSQSWVMVLPCSLLGAWRRVKTHGPESQPKEASKASVEDSPAPIASPFGD